MSDSTIDRRNEAPNGQHVNPDGETDAEKGAKLGAVGGAVTGAAAGSMMGPGGAVLGAVVGGVAGALGSGAAVAAVDTADDDSNPIGTTDGADRIDARTGAYMDPDADAMPGIQTGGHAVDGTPDTRGVAEKAADALTGDDIDDKTGKRVR